MRKLQQPTGGSAATAAPAAVESKAGSRLGDELAALQRQLKKETQQRKEAESVVSILADSFAELKRKVDALESANESLRAEVNRLQSSLPNP